MAASKFHFLLALLLITLHFATVNCALGFDMVFVRIDSSNQIAYGGSDVGVDDLNIPDPMSYEFDFDSTGPLNNQNSDFASVGGGVAAVTNDCSVITTLLCSVRNFTSQTAATYAPNVTAAAIVHALFDGIGPNCSFSDYNSSMCGGQALGVYEVQQAGWVTVQGSIIAWHSGEGGGDGASISGPNMTVAMQGELGGYTVWVDIYDEAYDDTITIDGEWWSPDVNAVFISSKYVSQYAELSLAASVQANAQPLGVFPAIPASEIAYSTMIAMYGEY